jgi:hypothetical protein
MHEEFYVLYLSHFTAMSYFRFSLTIDKPDNPKLNEFFELCCTAISQSLCFCEQPLLTNEYFQLQQRIG